MPSKLCTYPKLTILQGMILIKLSSKFPSQLTYCFVYSRQLVGTYQMTQPILNTTYVSVRVDTGLLYTCFIPLFLLIQLLTWPFTDTRPCVHKLYSLLTWPFTDIRTCVHKYYSLLFQAANQQTQIEHRVLNELPVYWQQSTH